MLTIEWMEFMQLDRRIYYRRQACDLRVNNHHKSHSGIMYIFFKKNMYLAFFWGGLGTECTAMAGTKQINASPPRHLKMWM